MAMIKHRTACPCHRSAMLLLIRYSPSRSLEWMGFSVPACHHANQYARFQDTKEAIGPIVTMEIDLQHVIVQADQIGFTKDQIEILQRFSQPKALHTVGV